MEKTNKAEDYLDEQFPKGDKKRGEAMCLYALTKLEARKELIEEIEKLIKQKFYCNSIDIKENIIPILSIKRLREFEEELERRIKQNDKQKL